MPLARSQAAFQNIAVLSWENILPPALLDGWKAEDLATLLNTSIEGSCQIIRRYHGDVVSITAVTIAAAFERPDQAVSAALALLEKGQYDGPESPYQPKEAVGIDYGRALVMMLDLGTQQKLGIYADILQSAERLRTLNRQYHSNIIVSSAVADQLRSDVKKSRLDDIILKAVAQPVTIYEVLRA